MPALLFSLLRWVLPGLLLIAMIAAFEWRVYQAGAASNEAQWQAKLVEQENAALKAQVAAQEKVNAITATLQADKRAINSKYVAAPGELRNRPADRLPEPARAACTGSTGAELSRQDAEAFARLAADADLTRAELKTCKTYINVIRGKT